MSNAESNDNDEELHLQPINFNAPRDELIQALKASQLSVVQLLAENRTLREENSELRANSTKKRRQGGEKDLLGYKSHIVALAKSFLITQALFVSLAAFRANPELPADPGEEFQSDEAYTLSITSKLYKEIPEKFHPLLDAKTYSTFAKDFIHEHGDGRSALIKVIRKTLPVILKGYNIDSDLLTIADIDRSKNDVLDRLLRFPADRKLTRYPPVLFPNGKQNMSEIFTGPIVMKIHRLMFFGPASLAPDAKPAQNSNGIKLGLKVTEESVSAAAILTRFVLSSDKAWAAKGVISGTEYEQDYRAYHKMLACNSHLPHVQKILETIRRFVFSGTGSPGTTTNLNADDESDETERAISDALMRFELGIDDPEEDANPDAPEAPEPALPPPIVNQVVARANEDMVDAGAEDVTEPGRNSRRGTRKHVGRTRKR
ncbi:hypothetical protein B0H13DRAFT_1884628 [Mycena leptocephala]|nr:hypothetical protein B0H13DRAFT_1884628 [Mycena leptocephala]